MNSRWKIRKAKYRTGGLIGKQREGYFVVNVGNPQHHYGPYDDLETARQTKGKLDGYDSHN